MPWDAHVLSLRWGRDRYCPLGLLSGSFAALLLVTGIRGTGGWSRDAVAPEHFYPNVGTERV